MISLSKCITPDGWNYIYSTYGMFRYKKKFKEKYGELKKNKIYKNLHQGER